MIKNHLTLYCPFKEICEARIYGTKQRGLHWNKLGLYASFYQLKVDLSEQQMRKLVDALPMSSRWLKPVKQLNQTGVTRFSPHLRTSDLKGTISRNRKEQNNPFLRQVFGKRSLWYTARKIPFMYSQLVPISPNFHIHVSVSNLNSSRICPYISHPGNI